MQELLLRAALLPDGKGLAAWHDLRPRLDLADVDASAQLLLPALHRNLRELGATDDLMPMMKGVHRYTWARNQVLLRGTLPVLAELERAGIPTLLLKGAALLGGEALDAGMRAMNDIDVLVPTSRTGDAIDVLTAAGLAPVEGAPLWYVAEYAPRFTPSWGFVRGDDCQLDLHWHALHASLQPNADDELWAAALPMDLHGTATRKLCPADELLLVILHGLRWDPKPTYRWVMDATLLVRGCFGAVDFDRLVAQARRRRVTLAVQAGLGYLRRLTDPPVPAEPLRALRTSPTGPLERLELRALLARPASRGALPQATLHYQQRARRELALGQRATPLRQARLLRSHLGLRRWSDLRHLAAGGVPGPGRPSCSTAAAVGAGEDAVCGDSVRPGQPLDFSDPDTPRRYVAHGVWQPEPRGCWLAGRETRLILPLARPATTSLAIAVSADAYLNDRKPRQRLRVLVNGRRIGGWRLGPRQPSIERGVLLVPRALVAGRTRLEVVLQAPDSVSPARLGAGDEQRQVSVFLRQLEIREPRVVPLGRRIGFGVDSGDDAMLAGGWSWTEPAGRWTVGPRAHLLLRAADPRRVGAVAFEAVPFLPRPARRLRVEVVANGRHLASLRYHAIHPRVARVEIPNDLMGPTGELLLSWLIGEPDSPLAHRLSDDRRALGLFLRRLVLLPPARDLTEAARDDEVSKAADGPGA